MKVFAIIAGALVALVSVCLMLMRCGGSPTEEQELNFEGYLKVLGFEEKTEQVSLPLLFPCKACDGEVSESGNTCPSCDHPVSGSIMFHKVLLAAAPYGGVKILKAIFEARKSGATQLVLPPPEEDDAPGPTRFHYPITDLSPLAELKGLKELTLTGNPIPNGQKAMLKKALPNCEIIY